VYLVLLQALNLPSIDYAVIRPQNPLLESVVHEDAILSFFPIIFEHLPFLSFCFEVKESYDASFHSVCSVSLQEMSLSCQNDSLSVNITVVLRMHCGFFEFS